MKVDINTKLITLIGTPLSQSFAARMQNTGYEAAGLNMLYFYTEADKEHLGDIVNGIRHMNFAGFAVTKPNKVRVLRYLDELDPLCQKMGASNTVVKTPEGKLVGYNTDGVGFYTSLTQEGGIQVDQSVFFCFGGGGAGRAMCSILAYHGARKIYITEVFGGRHQRKLRPCGRVRPPRRLLQAGRLQRDSQRQRHRHGTAHRRDSSAQGVHPAQSILLRRLL